MDGFFYYKEMVVKNLKGEECILSFKYRTELFGGIILVDIRKSNGEVLSDDDIYTFEEDGINYTIEDGGRVWHFKEAYTFPKIHDGNITTNDNPYINIKWNFNKDQAEVNKSICPDCKGSGRYVGFSKEEDCKLCQGEGNC